MARIKIVYIGGGSTRAPGTVATIVQQGHALAGSEVVLVDPHSEGTALTQKIAQGYCRAGQFDITITIETDRRRALEGADVVLTAFRPGGFAARVLDEKIPLRHGVIGQETQGPGGFFMALRALHVLQQVVAEMENICPRAWLINYTNPINIISEAITHHSTVRCYSFCEGPLYFPRQLIAACGLQPHLADVQMVGLNHACWSVRAEYDGHPLLPLIVAALPRMQHDMSLPPAIRRQADIAVALGTIPADYMQYYFYRDEILAEMQAAAQTRAEWILSQVPRYWQHYREQAAAALPALDPALARGGINELELAVDAIVALATNSGAVLPVNLPNGHSLPDFPPDRVVETWARFDRHGAQPFTYGPLPAPARALTLALSEYQACAAEVGWTGGRTEAIQALASNPLVPSLRVARVLYDEMAAAHRAYLPARLIKNTGGLHAYSAG